MSCHKQNPIKKIFEKTKKALKKNEEEDFAIHNKNSKFAWQSQATSNYNRQLKVALPPLAGEQISNQDEESQKGIKFNIHAMKESLVNEAQQNLNKIKSMFKNRDSIKNDDMQTQSKIPLKTQEQILQKQIQEHQKKSSSRPSSSTNIQFEEKTLNSQSTNILQKQDQTQKSATNDYTSISNKPKQESSVHHYFNDNKSPLIKHLESLSLSNINQSQSKQISSQNSLVENSNDYLSKEIVRGKPELLISEDLIDQKYKQQYETQLQELRQLIMQQNQYLKEQTEKISSTQEKNIDYEGQYYEYEQRLRTLEESEVIQEGDEVEEIEESKDQNENDYDDDIYDNVYTNNKFYRGSQQQENDEEIIKESNEVQFLSRQGYSEDYDQNQYYNMSSSEDIEYNEKSEISFQPNNSIPLNISPNLSPREQSFHSPNKIPSPLYSSSVIQNQYNQKFDQQDNLYKISSPQASNEINKNLFFSSSPISPATKPSELSFENEMKKVDKQQEQIRKRIGQSQIEDRSRKRTEKQIKDRKKKQQKLIDDGIADRKYIDQQKLPIQTRTRSMKDIQNGSMRTSYALTKRSFKWSTKAKNIVSYGKSILKQSGSSLHNENYFEVSPEDQYDDKQQKNELSSSEENMDLEDKVEDLQVRSPRMGSIDQQSQKITEQKGKQFKNRKMQKSLLDSQNEYQNYESQMNGWRALETFYTQLSKNSNHSDINSSVEIFGDSMTLFIDNQKNFQHIITRDSFVYHSSVGEGSFGQVDLYFFKQQSMSRHQSISISQYSQDTWHTLNSNIKNPSQSRLNQNPLLFSMNQSNESTPLNFGMGSIKQSIQSNSLFDTNFKQQNVMNDEFNIMSQSIQCQNQSPFTQALNSPKIQLDNQQLNPENQIQIQDNQYYQKQDQLLNQVQLQECQQIQNSQNILNKQKSQNFQLSQEQQQAQALIGNQQLMEYSNSQNYAKHYDLQLPVACKKIENLEEFTRELYIMQTVKCEYMPKLVFQDLQNQLLFMELGLCSLEDLKYDSEDDYTFTDEFTYQILINLIKAIESLLSNVDSETNTPQPLFHSDIKPSNVMLTVKKYKNQQNCAVKLLLIDYGGASFALEDYWSFYTPAFVSAHLWQKLVNATANNECLGWQEIRYAEIYAACRTVQYLIVPDEEKEYFKKENYELFLNKYTHLYPKTCYILKQVYNKEQLGQIDHTYDGILSSSEKTLYTGLNPQNIPFDCKRIFEISKFYNYFIEKKESSTESMDEEEVQNPQFEQIQQEIQTY